MGATQESATHLDLQLDQEDRPEPLLYLLNGGFNLPPLLLRSNDEDDRFELIDRRGWFPQNIEGLQKLICTFCFETEGGKVEPEDAAREGARRETSEGVGV